MGDTAPPPDERGREVVHGVARVVGVEEGEVEEGGKEAKGEEWEVKSDKGEGGEGKERKRRWGLGGLLKRKKRKGREGEVERNGKGDEIDVVK